ncbi:MAG: glycoside hydrolase family 15 protein [Gemmatimonadaceae bacterium]
MYDSPPTRIEDYALIGDCETAALVSTSGSIDWLAWPRFDSPACFAALLGTKENGRWIIAPRDPNARVTRRYADGSLILETTFETDTGMVVLRDFMPIRGRNSDVVRIVTAVRGRVEMATEIILRFSYGSIVPWVTRLDGGHRAIAGPDMVSLRTDVPLHGSGLTTVGEFALEEGQSASFVLTWGPSHEPPPPAVDPADALQATARFWKEWGARCSYRGEWREPVQRSLLTLKALTYHPTGGIVAAPTTSLPESIGSTRNWDYRFCWLRDATLTLLALMDAGYFDEAAAWRDWLVRAAAGSPGQAQIMYGLSGERHLLEWEVPWLPGFAGSRPVRIGNAAHAQFQLDVYGEVLDALHQARLGGIAETEEGWQLQRALARHVESVWGTPDQGLWESRAGPEHFTYSKVMAWVALDRAIKGVEKFGLKGPVDHWRSVRQQIHDEVCLRGYDAKQSCFTQAYGSPHLDASLLLIPLVGFLPPTDERVRNTISCIERRLVVDGLVLRYDTESSDDGLPPGEGAFLACSFWLADAYIVSNRQAEARALFERLVALRNDVGLLSEEYDPVQRRFLGNFPQAFSHVALVTTALNLEERVEQPHPAEQRAQDGAAPG